MNKYRRFLFLAALCLCAPAYAAKCNPNGICNACTNCSSCKNCSKQGGSCSVCRAPATAPVPQKGPATRPTPRATVQPPISTPAPAHYHPPAQENYYQTPDLEPSWIRQQRLEKAEAAKIAAMSRPAPSRAQKQSARNVQVPAEWAGKVVGVADGDTITVLYGKTPVRVRLYGVDAPETNQAFGQQAKTFVSNATFGKTVTIYGKGVDRYGRALGWVFVGSHCVNTALVEKGYAWHYAQYSPKETKLADAQNAAQETKVGLWVDAAPVAPWDFRKQK